MVEVREGMFQTALKRIGRDGHRRVDVVVFNKQDGPVKARPRSKPDSMDEDVGFLAGMFSSKGREEFLRCGVGANVQGVESTNGWKFIFQFEDPAHESLLVAQIQRDTCGGQLLANRPSD